MRIDGLSAGILSSSSTFEEEGYRPLRDYLASMGSGVLIPREPGHLFRRDEQIRLGVPLNDDLERSHCCPPPCPMNDDLRGMRRGFERPELSDLLCLFGAECMPEIPSLWRSIYVVAPPLRASPHSEDGITPSRSAAPCSRTGRPVYWRNAPEALRQTPVTVGRDCADHPQQSLRRQDGKETKAAERRRLESAAGKIRMRRLDNVVEADDLMVKLRADSADKPVAERRHLAKQDRRTQLGLPIHLWRGVSTTSPSVTT
ncbi:MAG: hypothetical protein ACYCX3_07200 [Thermoleophilia bacterium]